MVSLIHRHNMFNAENDRSSKLIFICQQSYETVKTKISALTNVDEINCATTAPTETEKTKRWESFCSHMLSMVKDKPLRRMLDYLPCYLHKTVREFLYEKVPIDRTLQNHVPVALRVCRSYLSRYLTSVRPTKHEVCQTQKIHHIFCLPMHLTYTRQWRTASDWAKSNRRIIVNACPNSFQALNDLKLWPLISWYHYWKRLQVITTLFLWPTVTQNASQPFPLEISHQRIMKLDSSKTGY